MGTIERQVRILSSQLASPTRPKITEQWSQTQGIKRYLDDRYGSLPNASLDVDKWITEYQHEIQGKNTAGWIRDSSALLERLKKRAGGLEKVTEKIAAAYMADTAANRTPGTHNRNLTVYKKFYTWLVNTGRHTVNPFATIKRMNERKDTQIVYCTKAERDEIIILALAAGWPEWTAVLIAFLTGMRREEVVNLTWNDVNFESGTISIRKTKTKTSRTIQMSTVLEEFLLGEPDHSGYVVRVLEGENRLGRFNSLSNRLKKDMKMRLTAQWGILKPPPSKFPEFRKNWNTYIAEMDKRKTEVEEALGRVGWNVFRHTFASLKVQDGVSIDKVARWIGDDVSTATRHYANFIPKDRRDPDVDKG